MTIESKYHQEFEALLDQYSCFGYVVLDAEFEAELKVLNQRYAL